MQYSVLTELGYCQLLAKFEYEFVNSDFEPG